MEKFFSESTKIDRSMMLSRIRTTCSNLGWRETIKYFLKKKIPFSELNVAEVGCGSGTFSLTLNMLGAKTTLIDYDEDALSVAKGVFDLYGRKASFVKADVSESPCDALKGRFDFISSGGLAEHFVGDRREKCIAFHKEILKKGGFTFIAVPNRLSLPYRIVRLFRELTGTWTVELEVPFSYWELKKYAQKVGFHKSIIFGNHGLVKDMYDYALGLGSAILDILPLKVRVKLNNYRVSMKKNKGGEKSTQVTEEQIVNEAVEQIKKQLDEPEKVRLKDYFSAGIILFGFNDK